MENDDLFKLARQTALARIELEDDATAQQTAGGVAIAAQKTNLGQAKAALDLLDRFRGENTQILTGQMGVRY